MWLAIVAIFGSAVALGIDELVDLVANFRYGHRDNYWIWVPTAIVFVAIAVVSV